MDQTKTEKQWAIVELFGHTKVAGEISEQQMGGCAFVRVDVPAVDDKPAYTRLYGNGAIYSVCFVDESVAREAAKSYRHMPYVPLRDPRSHRIDDLLEPPRRPKPEWPGDDDETPAYRSAQDDD